jgi:hypothetical protein
MQSNLRAKLQYCPKCQSYDTTKNGTVPGKSGRIQRFRCNYCKHIWNDATFKIKPSTVARGPNKPSSNTKSKQALADSGRPSVHSSDRSHSIPVARTQADDPRAFKPMLTAHRMLQLDIPLDWSLLGLLDFARAAQQNLVQAAVPFGHLGQAELEWEALSPALKGYIRARQHLDVALLLHLQTVLTPHQPFASSEQYKPGAEQQDQPKAAPQLTPKQRNERSQKQKRYLKATREKSSTPAKRNKNRSAAIGGSTLKLETEGGSSGKASGQAAIDEPDRANLLEVLSEFQAERQAWMRERTQLLNSVHELEEIKSQNTLRLSSVTDDFERLKKQVLDVKGNTQTFAPPATAKTNSTNGLARDSKRKAKNQDALPTSSSSRRTVPPKYTAREEANLERLASSLMANLVRLEGYRIEPRDLPHVTGERGPWKPVLEHLMTLGKIERRGDFIEISFAERLRRGL